MAEKSRVTTPRGRHESWCQASAVRGCVPILINPEFDAALDRDSEWAHLGRLCGTRQSFFFFFFFFLKEEKERYERLEKEKKQREKWGRLSGECEARRWREKSKDRRKTGGKTKEKEEEEKTRGGQTRKNTFFLSFRECCVTRQWQSVTQVTWYSGRSSMLSSDSWLIWYRRTKPPKPDASQFVVPARLPKPVIGSGGLSSSRFDDDVPEVNCTWTASFSWRVKETALWFESHGSKNLTGWTTWSSQSTSTDWLTRTHHWSSPWSKLAYKKPTVQPLPKVKWLLRGSKNRFDRQTW